MNTFILIFVKNGVSTIFLFLALRFAIATHNIKECFRARKREKRNLLFCVVTSQRPAVEVCAVHVIDGQHCALSVCRDEREREGK